MLTGPLPYEESCTMFPSMEHSSYEQTYYFPKSAPPTGAKGQGSDPKSKASKA
jgi:hypothetical protein